MKTYLYTTYAIATIEQLVKIGEAALQAAEKIIPGGGVTLFALNGTILKHFEQDEEIGEVTYFIRASSRLHHNAITESIENTLNEVLGPVPE